MINDIQPSTSAEENRVPFGKRLKSKREFLGLERKEAANHLRLNERVIIMMENDKYPADLPITFIRGYLRSYAKLLQIPEFEVTQVLQLIQAGPEQRNLCPSLQPLPQPMANYFFMQFFTYLILLTLLALVGTWWYRHAQPNANTLVESHLSTLANPTTTIDAHANFGTNATETAAIAATSATIEQKALADNKAIPPEQQKLATKPKQAPAIIAAAPTQKAVLSDDNTDDQEDDNEAE